MANNKVLSKGEILRIVNDYIGVSGGYLGDFTYSSHSDFYPIYCDLDIDIYKHQGTTRERFIEILSSATPKHQAKILKGVISRFPVEKGANKEHRKRLRDEIQSWAEELFHSNYTSNSLEKTFWTAYVTQLKELIKQDYFAEKFGAEGQYGCICTADDELINNFLKLKIGENIWPLDERNIINVEVFEKLTEALFEAVSMPLARMPCSIGGCPGMPTDYSKQPGEHEYTAKINQLFSNFEMNYKLVDGKLKHEVDSILSEITNQIPFRINDDYLLKLINDSLQKFRKNDFSSKIEGLKDIVDAFERVKSYKGKDIKKGTKEIISDVSKLEHVQAFLNTHLKNLSDIGNNTNIRHHKKQVELIEDEDLVEFLYYAHYNVLKLLIPKSLNK